MRFLIAISLAAILHTPVISAQEAEEVEAIPMTPETEPTLDCEEAITVFQDVSRFGRKKRAAENMTKQHAEMALEGWRLADMEIYIENGDLEGFFLSYIRAVACPVEAEN